MIDHLEFSGKTVLVHASKANMKTIVSFMRGSITFNKETRQVVFGSLPPAELSDAIPLGDGLELGFQLVGPDGAVRPQVRTGTLKKAEGKEIYKIAGQAKTAAKFSAEDGWVIEVFKYRAYFTHPGLITDPVLPEWLKASIKRQRDLWNRLAWLCREARRKCTPMPTEEIVAFVQETILPRIDAMNDKLGRSKLKMKHPAKLKVDMPGVDGLWNFVGQLRKRIEVEKPVPEGLLDEVVAFAKKYTPDYTPMNDFLNNLPAIARRESAERGLRPYEFETVVENFNSVLKSRKTRKLPWTDGWPLIKFDNDPRGKDWSLCYYFNKAGVKAEGLETGEGVPGLIFGAPRPTKQTGHPEMTGVASKRLLREATISVPSGDRKVIWSYRFGLLQHRPLPENSHIKQWELVYSDGKLWLCLTVEHQRPLPKAEEGSDSAGLDIGWRRTESGVRIGLLYEPHSRASEEITVDLLKSPGDPKDRGRNFRVDLGPTTWERQRMYRLVKEGEIVDSPAEQPNAFIMRSLVAARISYYKDDAKLRLRKLLGERVPAWFDKAGKKGIFKVAEEFKDNAEVQQIVADYRAKDAFLQETFVKLVEKAAGRLEYGYEQIAHEVCRFLVERRCMSLAIEKNFLSKVAKQTDPALEGDEYALKNSQKYRQFVAVGKFVSILKRIAPKYGIVVKSLSAENTTRLCTYCGHLNAATAKERYPCEKCERLIDQDLNAAMNLSQFAHHPEMQTGSAESEAA